MSSLTFESHLRIPGEFLLTSVSPLVDLIEPTANVDAQEAENSLQGRNDLLGDVVTGVDGERRIPEHFQRSSDHLYERQARRSINDNVGNAFAGTRLRPTIHAGGFSSDFEGRDASAGTISATTTIFLGDDQVLKRGRKRS